MSFDDLIGGREELIRNGEPDRLSRFEVDDPLELCRQLNWKLVRFLISKYAVNVGRRFPKHFRIIDP
jgi:hypothetical protein